MRKMKKILACVLAATMTIGMMTVAASAASLEKAPEGKTEEVLMTGTFYINEVAQEGAHTFNGAWGGGDALVAKFENVDPAIMTDSNVYVKATLSNLGTVTGDDGVFTWDDMINWGFDNYKWASIIRFYNTGWGGIDIEFSADFVITTDSSSAQAVAYVPITEFGLNYGTLLGGSVMSAFSSCTLEKMEIVKFAEPASEPPVSGDPNTGDSARTTVWMILAFAGIAVVATFAGLGLKKKEN